MVNAYAVALSAAVAPVALEKAVSAQGLPARDCFRLQLPTLLQWQEHTLTRSVGLAMAMARAPVVSPAATLRYKGASPGGLSPMYTRFTGS